MYIIELVGKSSLTLIRYASDNEAKISIHISYNLKHKAVRLP